MASERDSMQFPDSPETLREPLRDSVGEILIEKLKARLQFAKPREVAELTLAQIKHGDFTIDKLNERLRTVPTDPRQCQAWLRTQAEALAAGYWNETAIGDCDLVAEFGRPSAAEPRRDEIRLAFRERFQAWVKRWVESALDERGTAQPGDTAIEEISEKALDAVFSREPWERTLREYCPDKGKTFERYLERQILWRIQDEADALLSAGIPVPLEGEDAGAEESGAPLLSKLGDSSSVIPSESTEATEEIEERIRNAREVLHSVFECVRKKDLSDRKIAIVCLHFKAYLEPDWIPEGILRAFGVNRKTVSSDYLQAQSELAVRREEYQQAAAELATKEAVFAASRRALETAYGLKLEERSNLQSVARNSSITELEEELKALDENREKKWAVEVRFMLATKRLGNALADYRKACARIVQYDRYMKPFIRTQKEIASLLHANPGSIGRERAEALPALKECLNEIRGDLKFEDLFADHE